MTANGHPPQKFSGWRNVGLLAFLQFALSGFVYFAYSAIFPFMVEAMDWNRGSASIAHSIALVVFGLGYPIAGYLIQRIGAARTYNIGILIMFAGLLPIATVMDSLWQWIILWGFVVGFGLSLTSPVVGQTVLIAWFLRKRALTIGIIMTGGAIGGAISQPALIEIVQQSGSWQSGWFVALGMTALAAIAIRFVINRPGDVGQFADNIPPQKDDGGDGSNSNAIPQSDLPGVYRTNRDWSIAQVLRTRALYLMLILSIGHLITFFFLLSHGLLFLTDRGIDAVSAATIMSLSILGSGAARVPAGWLGDRYSLRWLALGSALLLLIGLGGLWLSHGFWFAALASATMGAGYGALLVLNPTIIGNYFGEKAFPVINAGFAPIVLPFAGAAPVVGGYIYEATESYDLAFAIIAGFLTLAAMAAAFLSPPE